MRNVALLAFRHRAAEVSFFVGGFDGSLLLLTRGEVCQTLPADEVLLLAAVSFELQFRVHTNAAA